METKSPPLDLNTIPYDAPLSFPEPSQTWIRQQNDKGRKGTYITSSIVPETDLSGKWVIITGSNNGIGREAALQMALWGAKLVLACRKPPAHETHPDDVVEACRDRAYCAGHRKVDVEWWELDMADLASVEAFASRWLATGRSLDILANNAGMGSSPNPMPFLTKDGFEIIHQASEFLPERFACCQAPLTYRLLTSGPLQVNFLSHVLLTLRLLPSLGKAPAPRIICTTSCFHYPGKFDLGNWNGEKGNTGPNGVQYYMNNKLNFQIWLSELQHRLLQHSEYKHITVNGVHPGYVNSGIWSLNGTQPWLQMILKAMAWFMGITPQQGSLAITYAATSIECGPNAKTQGVGVEGGLGGGRYFNRIWEEEPMPHTKDEDCRLRVWRKVSDELHLQEKGLLDVLGLYKTG